MRHPVQLKRDFVKKWATGLQVFSSRKEMDIWERKKAIKLSADLAMAVARTASTCWSGALIAKASKDNESKVLVEQMLDTDSEKLKRACFGMDMYKNKRARSKKILKRSYNTRRARKTPLQMVLASSIAKRLVNKRTLLLKRLVPGGEFMDEFSLIKETLDYMVSLQVQVDMMRRLAYAAELSNHA